MPRFVKARLRPPNPRVQKKSTKRPRHVAKLKGREMSKSARKSAVSAMKARLKSKSSTPEAVAERRKRGGGTNTATTPEKGIRRISLQKEEKQNPKINRDSVSRAISSRSKNKSDKKIVNRGSGKLVNMAKDAMKHSNIGKIVRGVRSFSKHNSLVKKRIFAGLVKKKKKKKK